MKLKTRGKDYVFMINGKKVIVCYDGKRETVIELKINDGTMSMETETRNHERKEVSGLPIDYLNFSINIEAQSGFVYKVRTCENHLMLFRGNEFHGEVESIKGLNGKSTLEISLKKLKPSSLKFHI